MGGGKSIMSVDKRVVQMTFDNRQFEGGVKTSMSTLDRLKRALNFDGATKSLSNLETAGKNFSLSGMESGVAALSNRFSTMGVVGFTVIQNLTNSAINAGKRMMKALTGPIVEGGLKRALNIEKAKFQFKGLGMDVEATMASALAAVEGTAFGLDEAAVAASMFGATGMRAGQEMTNALRGISGVAAMTGNSYSDIAQIFTTVAGNGRLMGNEMYRLGTRSVNVAATLSKQWGLTEEAVKKMVSRGEVSFDMFAKAMDDAFGEHATKANETYTGSLANMKSALGRIGEFVQAAKIENLRKVFNALTPVINEVNKALRPLTMGINHVMAILSQEFVHVLTSLYTTIPDQIDSALTSVLRIIDNLLAGISRAFIILGDILTPIEKAFSDVFTGTILDTIIILSVRFKDLIENFKIGEKTADNIRSAFKGVFALFDMGIRVLATLGKGLIGFLRFMSPVVEGLLYVAGGFGEFIFAINETLKATNIMGRGLQKLADILRPFAESIRSLISSVAQTLGDLLRINTSEVSEFSNNLADGLSPLAKIGAFVVGALGLLGRALSVVVSFLEKALFHIGGILGQLRDLIVTGFRTGNWQPVIDMLKSGVLVYIGYGFYKFATTLGKLAREMSSIWSQFASVFGMVRGVLKSYQEQLKANILIKIATALAIMTGSIMLLSFIEPDKLNRSVGALTVLFAQLAVTLVVFEKYLKASNGVKNTLALAVMLTALAGSILLLAVSVRVMSGLDWASLVKGLVGVTALLATLVGATKLLKMVDADLKRTALSFIGFAVSILILTHAVKKLGALDIATIGKGILGVAGLALALGAFMYIMGKNKYVLSGGMSIALTLLALSIAMSRMVKTLTQMGALDIETIKRGLIAMVGSLTAVAVALALIPPGALSKLSLLVVAKAILVLADALKAMGALSVWEIIKSMYALTFSLALLTLAMNATKEAIPGAVSLLIVSAAMITLSIALKALAAVPFLTIGNALLKFVAIVATISIVTVVFGKAIPFIMLFGVALKMLGVGLLVIGASLLVFSAGLAALTAVGTAGIAVIGALVGSIIVVIPTIAKALASGFITFIKTVFQAGFEVGKAFGSILLTLIEKAKEIAPKIIGAVSEILKKMLAAIVDFFEPMVKAGFALILALLRGISDHSYDIIRMGIAIIINLINGIESKIDELLEAGARLIISFINGMADKIEKYSEPLIKAISKLVDVLVDAALKAFEEADYKWEQVGANMITGLAKGLGRTPKKVFTMGWKVGENLANGTMDALGIKSPSRVSYFFGRMYDKGLELGILKDRDKPVDAAKKMMDQLTAESGEMGKKAGKNAGKAVKTAFELSMEWIEDRKYYNQLSLQQELEAWERIHARYAAGSDERKKADREIYRLKNALVKEEFDNSRKWMDDRKYYQELTLQEELAGWERVHARYLEGTEERKEADKQLFRLKNELVKSTYQNSIKWIENEKFYERETLNSRLAGYIRIKDELEKTLTTDVAKTASADWEKNEKDIFTSTKALNKANTEYNESITSLYENTNTRRIEMEKEYYETTKSINDKLISDVKNLNNEYENAVKSRADALYSTHKLFDEIDPREVDGVVLVNNLKSQVIEFDDWRRSLQELTAKGVDEGLIRELEKLGPKTLYEIRALNNLNKPMLDKYVHLWQKKHEEARKQSTRELEYLRVETEQKVADLNTAATKELDEYKTAWLGRIETLVTDTIKQAKKLETEWLASIGEITSTTERDFALLVRKLERHLLKPDWSSLGKSLIDGVTTGIYSGAKELESALIHVSDSAYTAMEKANGIASPSKEYMKIGRFCIDGLVLGLTKFAGQVYTAGAKVGNVAKDALRDTIGHISDVVNGDMDMVPTIRPVLDLSDIHAGNREMASIFGDRTLTTDGRSLALSRSIGSTRAEQDSVLNVLTKLMSTLGKTGSEPKEITNEFNIENLQVREEADVRNIARQLYQLQVAGSRG